MSWNGIDISNFQGVPDFAAVKAAGYDFCIAEQADGDFNNPYFGDQLDAAHAAGLHTGAYYLSHATSAEESASDARDMIAAIQGHTVDMPLYIDLEASEVAPYADAIAKAWYNECIANGYKGGVYVNLSWWQSYLDRVFWADKPVWGAAPDNDESPDGDWGIWQHDFHGAIAGNDCEFDLDIAYVAEWSDPGGDSAPTPAQPAQQTKPKPIADQHPIAPQIDDKFACKIKYQAHVQNVGWMGVKSDFGIAGTTGQSLRLEALAAESGIEGVTVEINGHVQDIGWQGWRNGHDAAGTSGGELRLEAIKARLTGENAESYDIFYRAHIQSIGWMGWAANGDIAGSVGCSLRAEAVQAIILEKGVKPEGVMPISNYANCQFALPALTCQAHVHNLGWMTEITGSPGGIVTIGTTGMSLGAEALRIAANNHGTDVTISGKPHIANIGWCEEQDGVSGIGSTGQSRPLEAISLQRHGTYQGLFDIWYRAHVQNIGWMGWTKNGGNAGTTGYGLRLEAAQIALLPTGSEAPGSTDDVFRVYKKAKATESNDYRGVICGIATSQVGYVEDDDWTEYGQWYEDTFNAPGFAKGEWCAMFVSWCARRAGVSESILKSFAYVPSFVRWFAGAGRLHDAYGGYEPQAGDVIFFRWDRAESYDCDHVGLVVGFDGETVTTVEGNTGNGTPAVCIKEYGYTDDFIIWYGEPKYN